ncbi:alpha/beta fold hydrolase [Rhizorhabdus argentea]|uniref:alpha/beta fold hydrolase n=1 Tax=Rhizorhabdus argentea TaxID=1387174 RepID=UPI0030EF0D85
MPTPRTRRITSSRLQLNITEWGDPLAPPLVLQHGGRDHGRSWDAVAAAFLDDYHVIVPDLRGHGDSDWASDGAYDLVDHVQDFTTLTKALDLPPCPFVGHSLGGNIVTRFAGLYPDRVTKLVNIEGLGLSPKLTAEREKRDAVDVLRNLVEQRALRSAFVPRRYPDLAAMVARFREANERLSPELAEHLARHAVRVNEDGSATPKHDPAMQEAALDITTETKHRLWAAISCPVLLVYGAQSWASNPAVDGRAAHFRDARVEVFEDAGHWVHHDRQADFIAMVRDFLRA